MKPEKQLYQWDVNQFLIELQPTAEFVDYPMGNEVIRIKSDGTRCRIPDEVLQTYGGKTCYERYTDGTYRAYSFTVLYSPKPPDYVFTPEERTTFEALTARVDSAIEEIKRRADSGEFTPVKGVDYLTDAEKNEMMESVSSGAVGEFRKVVDTATTEYNDNHNLKLDKYNANAAEKLTTYDTNAEQHTTDYNRNAAEKLESYNQNHAAKVAEYNQNAETKTAEFDANAAALQTEVDRLRGECDKLAAEKANIDGYYEEMTVGDAEQLVATQFVEDNEPYLFRLTGGSSDVGNRAYIDQIVGGTVVWNQMVLNANKNYTNGETTDTRAEVTLLIQNTVSPIAYVCDTTVPATGRFEKVFKVTQDIGSGLKIKHGGLNRDLVMYVNNDQSVYKNHVYAFTADFLGINPTVANGLSVNNIQLFDLTQMFGSTIADYIYSLEQSQAGAGVAWFKKLFPKDYYPYNAGELLSVEGLQSHDTVWFNQWDEEWEVGYLGYSSSNEGQPIPMQKNTIRSKNFIKVFPNTSYYFNYPIAEVHYVWEYDENKNALRHYQLLASGNNNPFTTPSDCRYIKFACEPTYGTTYKHDICINLSSPSRNGEYEPYKKHSYPLDSSLTLRGIPKLDVSNNLYYDGDEYESDGTVTRKYGVVDLGTLDWGYQASGTSTVAPYMYTDVTNLGVKRLGPFGTTVHNIICSKYTTVAKNPTTFVDKTICADGDAYAVTQIQIKDTDYTDAATFKAAMSGVMLVYELATPTTETAEPFQHIQIVDDFGTEEFASTGIVPVGHNTRYPANLRDKLQHLPSLASADGTYLIQQSGKQMSLVHMPAVFPDAPTEDGTYTLKTVVTGGVATLQWVAE